MPSAAIAAIARSEWAARRRALLTLGLVAGLIGGLLLGGVGLARRTTSAPDRLLAAVAPGDVHLRLFVPDVPSEIRALPQVSASTAARLAVGRLDGPGVVYLGMVALDDPHPEVLRPVVVAGRAADPAADDEVVLVEDVADALGLEPGSTLVLTLLTPEEVAQFDVGFGDPDGLRLELTVAGIVRVPPDVLSGSPMIATPAVGERIGDGFAGTDLYVQLHDPESSTDAFVGAAQAVADGVAMPEGAEEFPPMVVADPAAGTVALRASMGVLVAGLLVALGAGGLAAAVVVWQAFGRHHAATGRAQAVEAALGLTARERALARALPASASAAVAGVVACATALVLADMKPPGAVARIEPDLGRRPDLLVVIGGAAAVAALVLLVAFLTARRAGVSPVDRPPPRRVGWTIAPHRGGWPFAGAAFALSGGDRRGRVPVRASLAGAVVGIAGVVAAAIFGASLDRLTATPERYGWEGDVVVVDVTDAILEELIGDPRIDAVADLGSASIPVGGRQVQAYGLAEAVGEVGWVVLDGRRPRADDELVLGTQVASQLGLGTDDRIDIEGLTFRVVGVGVGPALSGERLGDAILLHPDGLDAVTPVQLFREALVRFGDEVDVESAIGDLAGRYEITVADLPPAVRNVADLGILPEVLGGFLALLAVVALAHALAVTSRRRARDLAVLHALGSTRREVGLTVVAMAVSTVVVGIVLGAPLGWLTARLAWGEVARAAGVAPDVLVPASLPAVLVVAVVVAAVVAVVPAARVARRLTPRVLRQE